MEDRPPLFLGLQIDEVFRVEETRGIGSVIGPPHLTGTLPDFRKRTEEDSRLVCHPDALGWSGAWSKRSANPEGTFIQVR